MQFAKLRLSGFKSFVDPTELIIDTGMTGIVGPNGCGKSNLVEALRWAMGENSAKRMRGGEMDDVIFGGTGARPARNIAEVTLALENPGRDAPKPYDDLPEIEIVRRIERGAGSDYRINGREVRARDVQLLFADAATGAHSAALVSQGRVGAIINAKPSERRILLEEASGISGLHSRRHEAELRLKGAETNLTRLDDVLRGLEAQLEGLKKQARQANRYRRLSEHIRRAEAVVLHLRWQRAVAEFQAAAARFHAAELAVADRTAAALAVGREREAAGAELPALRQTEASAGAELQRLVLARQALEEEERRVVAARHAAAARLDQMASDIAREAALAADAEAALERLETEHRALAEAQGLEGAAQERAAAALAAIAAEVATLDAELTRLTERLAAEEAQRAALTRRHRESAERLARLAERQQEIATAIAALETEKIAVDVTAEAAEAVQAAEATVARTSEAAEEAETALRRAQEAEAATRTPKEAAEAQRAKLNTERQALIELLAAMVDKRFSPILDAVSVASGYEAALGAALGEDLTAPLDAAAPAHWFALPDYAETASLPGDVAPLSSFVVAPAALARRLAQIGVVADRDMGEKLQPELKPGQRLVSREGGLWRWDGFRRGAGTPTSAAQRLRQRNRIAELDLLLADAETALGRCAASLAEAQAGTRRLADDERAAREAAREAVGTLAMARDREAELARNAAGILSRLNALTETAERLAHDAAEAEADRTATAEALAALPDPALGREAAAAARDQLAERRSIHLQHQAEHDRLTREAQARRERIAAIADELSSWRQREEAAVKQHAAFVRRRDDLQNELGELQRRPAEIAEQRERLAATIADSTARRNNAADALAVGETRLAEAEKASKAADAELAAAREERVRCEGVRDQAHEAQTALTRHIEERLSCAPQAVLEAAGIPADEELPPPDDAQARLDRLTRERDTMGPVNLVAEAEAAEIEERLNGLIREREDLIGAIARLRQGIAALNREGRERLLAAFATVNEHFTKLFTRLFGGGRAYLKLDRAEPVEGESDVETAANDPLDAGLEIYASPPGKKLQTLSLLSGGEQALTALALIFAVFLTNPAPICVLDEVDAPLDDANVDRFCRLVEEIAETAQTRFLIITHHRLTMARVHRLFGVTMAEQGISQLVSVDLENVEQLRRTG
ncbi:MAG TPA: chromosome segregation protein SMC [Stellaceae bacterium]|nr:chromosome segregation protein SMC [Stellaceae bacterium]